VWSRILAKAAAPIRGYESPRHTKFKTVNGPSGARILLIEDEEKTARAIVTALETEGFAASWAGTGEEGFFLLNSERFDALVLDWMLPGRIGLEVLKALRTKDIKMPVLLLTARDALEDRIAGLDGGADDYLIKPFARMRRSAAFRR
jgi:DNA-binding response OmpR family regulator